MIAFQQKILNLIKCFRRQWHLFSNSERTTVCGADCMMMALQLSMAEVNKQVQLLEFICGIMNEQENNDFVLSAPSTPVKKQGQENVKVRILAKKCVCSYLSLLVNSKDDLALAQILNVPDRGLGREAFTKLKHASQARKMSIFLMATSFIRTVELGGRGCASSLFDPLKVHIKGLSNFVNFVDKLQEIVGEILNPRVAGGRILSTVKMHLIKGRSNGDPFCQAVEEVVEYLDLKIKNISDSQHEVSTASTTGVSPARVKQSSIKSQFACTYKNELSEIKDQSFLGSSQIPTCRHAALKQHLKPGYLAEGMNSCLDVPVLGTISENVHQTRSYTDTGNLSCQPRSKNSKNEQMDLNNDKVICDKESEPFLQKNAKRPKTSNSPQKELNSKIAVKGKQSKTARKIKLIAGQSKLTNFFRL